MPEDEPKIIIDEGWKAQVERERELARLKAEEAGETPESPESPEATVAPESAGDGDVDQQEEPASFESLIGSLATQCMFALGVIAPEGSERVMVDLNQAKYLIDLLEILRDKTKGNLSPAEEGALREALAELQRVFVARVQQFQEHAMRQAGIDPTQLKQ